MSQIKLLHSGGNGVILAAPSSNPASDLTLKLPQSDGSSGQAIVTDASGNLSFADAGGGKILQVKQAVKTDTSSTTNFGWVTIPGTDETGSGSLFEVNITPAANSSKILVNWGIHFAVSSSVYSGGLKLRRDSTDLFIGDTSGSRTRASNWVVGWSSYGGRHPWFLGGTFLDSPNTTSQVTYQIQYTSGYDSNYVVYVNRPHDLWDNAKAVGVTPSSITCQEVAA
tara:strand:- start:664 stop:1338 length:675 start_codon:yes stop_codon:yes gene_type:complete